MTAKRKTLTKVQHDKMRSFLVDRRHRLQAGVRGQIEGSDLDETDRGGDEGDMATFSLRDDINMDVRARETRELQLIEQAIDKIDAGSYGTCEDCGGGIAIARLEALPFAQFCIDCQEKYEADGAVHERREFQVPTD